MMAEDMSGDRRATGRDEGLVRYLTEAFVGDYQQGRITRREAVKRIAGIVGGLAAAEALLACRPLAEPTPATTAPPPTAAPPPTVAPSSATAPAVPTPPAPAVAQGAPVVAPDDPTLETAMIEYPGDGTAIFAYLARPKGEGRHPGVLVCHENRGLTDHIEDVARRLAKEGYVALAVDLLTRQGGFDKIADPGTIPGLLSAMPPEQIVADFRGGLAYLQSLPSVRGDRIGMTGFCFGGGVTWRCATQIAELSAAAPFYGPNPPLEDVPKIQAAVLAIYGEADTRITSGAPAIEAALKQHNKTYEIVIYPNAQHAFFNDTGTRYDPTAAAAAWAKLLGWFATYLS